LNLRKEFDLPITFRKLSEEYVSPLLLVEYLEKNLPKDYFKEDAIHSVEAVAADTKSPHASEDLVKAVEAISHQMEQLSLQLDQLKALLPNQNKASDNLFASEE